jgi:hypothetical protein
MPQGKEAVLMIRWLMHYVTIDHGAWLIADIFRRSIKTPLRAWLEAMSFYFSNCIVFAFE